LIIGAGASCEAGLPSGEGLKKQIAEVLDIRYDDWGQHLQSGDKQIVETLRAVAREENERSLSPYLEKAWRIRDIVPTAAISIDNYLDAHRGDAKMELCGKLGIVKSILMAEAGSKLKRQKDDELGKFNLRDLGGTWYVSFLNMLTEQVGREDAASALDNVSIITFNYDRCIERFLAQALADYYDFRPEQGQGLVNSMPIYHPYGVVGCLPWQSVPNRGIEFGSTARDLRQITGQIKTFTEGLDDENMLRSMRSAVAEAETVVFLGFAFHPINMELLRPTGETAVKRIFATTLGLSDSDEGVIEDDIAKMLNRDSMDFFHDPTLKPQMVKMTCGDFFKHFFRSLSAPVAQD
jgi:hypothetical protein